MRLAATVLLLLSVAATAQDAIPGYKAGDKVEVFWGDKWWPATVLKAEEKRWFIHYDGFADSWDSWFTAEKMRARAGGGATPEPVRPAEEKPPVTGDPVVGEVCEGSWNQSWYEVDILKVENGKYFVHWRGYGTESDEWLTRDRLRRKGEEKEVLPRKGREGNGGGLVPDQMIGKEVEVFWHGRWWPAVVQKTDGKRLHIRYTRGTGGGALSEEWAVPERVREVGGAARIKVDPQAVPGRKGLTGLWWRQIGAPGSFHIQHFLFFPDGRLYFGLPDNPDEFDFEGHQKSNPDGCGGYGLRDEQLFVELGGDADEWKPMTWEKVSDDVVKLNGVFAYRARPLPEDLRLEGRYVSVDAAAITEMGEKGGVATSTADVYVFRKDGTYDYSETLMTGVAKAGVAETATNLSKGRYRFSGNHLVNDSPPHRQVVVAYALGEEDAPYDLMRIGDSIVRLRKK
ncbi:MAG: hypothetical protein IT452_23910 [Planctomycetia bacterium]|nr:hypothetical protein [Planctomycetia bacterium]